MTDRPIPFKDPMVRAILEGRKTQTRRVLKHDRFFENGWPVLKDGRKVGVSFEAPTLEQTPYRPGDRLWVREAHAIVGRIDPGWLLYRANGYDAECERHGFDPESCPPESTVKWRPSIHMHRWASRLSLIVTDVRVQRVQDITDDDAVAEGIERLQGGARAEFHLLWNSINANRDGGAYAWKADPWVVAITFEPQHCNIDKMGGA